MSDYKEKATYPSGLNRQTYQDLLNHVNDGGTFTVACVSGNVYTQHDPVLHKAICRAIQETHGALVEQEVNEKYAESAARPDCDEDESPEQMGYVVLTASKLENLIDNVRQHQRKGWVVSGSVSEYHGGVMQAMVYSKD